MRLACDHGLSNRCGGCFKTTISPLNYACKSMLAFHIRGKFRNDTTLKRK